MRKIVALWGLSWLLGGGAAFAQFQIPDAGFEAWANSASGGYQEPASGWWTSLNPLASLGAPVSVQKDPDAHGGSYSARLTSVEWGSLLIPGLLVSGDFDIQDPGFIVQGQPCTDRPAAFRGWYKYSPVAGDSAGIAALLTRWNVAAQRRDTLAIAASVRYDPQATWAAFDLPFLYLIPDTVPDTLLVALVSSQGGRDFQGQPGSTLWIDDLELAYGPTAVAAPTLPVAQVHHLPGHLRIDLPPSASSVQLRLADMQGRLLLQAMLGPGTHELPLPEVGGVYCLGLQGRGVQPLRRSFLHRP